MNKEIQPEITNILAGRLTETIYITVETSKGDEIEFTRYSSEEYGNISEFEISIEDEEQQEIFDNLTEEEQDEIEVLIQSVKSEDY